MTEYSHDELLELAAGYALGALSEEEARAVDEALPDNPALAVELHGLHNTIGAMLREDPPIQPRESLRKEWLARVRARRGAQHKRARSQQVAWVLGAALAASVVALLTLGAKLRDTRLRFAATAASAEELNRQLSTLLAAESALQLAVLNGSRNDGSGAHLFWNVTERRGLLHTFHVPPAPAGRAYVLWLMHGDEPIPVRVFDSGANGHAIIEQLNLPETTHGIGSIVVTVEPVSGSARPSSAPILVGALPHSP
jgi:anti-sigma-K factor RskA